MSDERPTDGPGGRHGAASESEPDFGSLSRRQHEALCNIAFGGDGGGFHPRTLESLTKLGLIKERLEQTPTPLGMLTIKKYDMPIHVHVRFCEWCSEQEGDGL